MGLIAGRYRIEGKLGRGGVGEVLRVLDVERGKRVALKRLPALSPPQVRAQFEFEFRTLASLRNPRVVQAHEFGRDAAGSFYTMELLDGDDLAARTPLPWREVCALLHDAAEGLGVLHARGLVHRDVSVRNLWRTPDGRLKLLDLGAIASFGPPPNLVGTPPCVPPEALERLPLDARADLFALGAVAYYLLTGLNAFPARAIGQLPELWAHEPTPPSQAIAELGRDDLPAIPLELDALVAALLSRSPLGRPSSTAQLLDRLDHLRGESSGAPSQELAEAQLAHPAFVGRERERRRLRRLFALASHGRGQSVAIECAPGLGRTRLLRELALELATSAATVVYVDAGSQQGAFATATALVGQLLDVQPVAARLALQPYAPALAQVSARLRERLGLASAGAHVGGVRMRAQMAMRDWLLALARKQPLVLLIDGLERADEESLSLLLSLSLSLAEASLLLVTSMLAPGARRALEDALCRASRRLPLRRFDAATVLELMRSVLGADDRVPRLALRLDEKAQGNPGHLLELCRQLMRRNELRFVSGAWVVPHELLEGQLAETHGGALRARVALLEPAEHEVACALSIHDGGLSAELEAHLLSGAQVAPLARMEALANLLDQGLLVRGEDGLRFAHEEQRELLRSQLAEPTRRVLAHRLGEYLLAQPSAGPAERIRAGVLLLQAGDPRALAVLQGAGLEVARGRRQLSGPLLVELERALHTLEARGVPERELLGLLVPLAIGSYVVDLRAVLRNGPAAVEALAERLGLARARRWQPVLGPRRSLRMSLALTKLELRGDALDYPAVFNLLIGCALALAATACELVDPTTVLSYAEALAPLAALGTDHLGGIAFEYCRSLVASARDDALAARASWTALLARLEDPRPIRHMTEHMRSRYRSGAQYALAVSQAREEDPEALRSAARIEATGLPMQLVRAEEIRALYHGSRGDFAQWEANRARAEQHAAQHGASFHFEVWDVLAALELNGFARDATGLKRTSERLAMLSEDFPSLRASQERCRAGYLELHGRHREALALLAEQTHAEPLVRAGWLQANVQSARIHNRLAEFAEARALCERALEGLRTLDARSSQQAMLLAEHALAQAGSGDLDGARVGLSALMAASEGKGALRWAYLREVEAQIALLAGVPEQVERALAEFEQHARQTGISTLIQRAKELCARVQAPNARLAALSAGVVQVESTWSRVERTLGGGLSLTQRCARALEMLAERAGVARGQLYLMAGGDALACCASIGDAAPAEVEDWMRSRLAAELEDSATAQVFDEQAARATPDVMPSGDELVRLLPLSAPANDGHGVVGAVLLFARGRAPGVPPDLITSISVHLSRAVTPGGRRRA